MEFKRIFVTPPIGHLVAMISFAHKHMPPVHRNHDGTSEVTPAKARRDGGTDTTLLARRRKTKDMLKFIGSAIGIIFLIGLLVVIGLFSLIF